jgi:hypothetical protein
MNNFISTFDELNKLYEEDERKKKATVGKEACDEDDVDESLVGTAVAAGAAAIGSTVGKKIGDKISESVESDEEVEESIIGTAAAACVGAAAGKAIANKLTEDEEVEDIIDDETSIEEEPVEEESVVRQLALECANCGAITIKDEADVKVDEETDLANMEDTCEFCEEAKGHKIVGVVTPYEEEIEIVDDEEEVTEGLVEGITVKYGRGKPEVKFDTLEDAVKHINDGMKKKAEDSYILYNNGKEMIWLDWYQASRDGSNNDYTVSRQEDKKTIKFEPKVGLSIIGELDERYDDEVGSGWSRSTPYSTQKGVGVWGNSTSSSSKKEKEVDWYTKYKNQQNSRSEPINSWDEYDRYNR